MRFDVKKPVQVVKSPYRTVRAVGMKGYIKTIVQGGRVVVFLDNPKLDGYCFFLNELEQNT